MYGRLIAALQYDTLTIVFSACDHMTTSYVRIGLINPKDANNVGSIMRAAGCFNVQSIRYTGTRYGYAAKFQTDTQKASHTIPLRAVDSLFEEIDANTQVVCIELVEGAVPLPDFQHPENALYIFGPEDGSISQDIINQAHHVVYIPTKGCLNLAATANIVLYDRNAKLNSITASDELIRNSRDNNNHLVVKK